MPIILIAPYRKLVQIISQVFGNLLSVGTNANKNLGLGDTAQRNVLTPVNSDLEWKCISAGNIHGAGIKSDGTLWTWGDNAYGQLGFSSNVDRPTQVGTDKDWKQVSASSGSFTVAIKEDGSMWSCGYNGQFQLGLGLASSKSVFTRIGTDVDWKFVSTGTNHSFAIKNDGSLWCWGYNIYGQLGLGDTNERAYPTRVGNRTDWKSVSCGDSHTLATTADGNLHATGRNNFQQIGLAATTPQVNQFASLGAAGVWDKVCAGAFHSFAFRKDGTLWGWGRNNYGQLGLGGTSTTIQNPAQVQMSTVKDWKLFETGSAHCIAIAADGTLWGWGRNNEGQLGLDADQSAKTVPTKISNDNSWTLVEAGGNYTLACRKNATIPYAVWNSEDKHASLTLSNGNLTASAGSANGYAVRANVGKSAGKWYWEVSLKAFTNGSALVGIASKLVALQAIWGSTYNFYVHLTTHNHYITRNNARTSYGSGGASVGDVIGIALDLDNFQLVFYKNGVAMGAPISIVADTYYPCFCDPATNFTTTVDANFGGTPFKYSVPTGFNAGIF